METSPLNLTPQQVHVCLLSTLSPLEKDRTAAEQSLKKLHQIPGFTQHLISVLSSQNMDFALRQSAAIYFKNLVLKEWQTVNEVPNVIFPDDLKVWIRKNVFGMLEGVSLVKGIEVQLGEALFGIFKYDYPAHWDNVVEEILAMINTQVPAKIRSALYILRVLSKKYEYTTSYTQEKKDQSSRIVEITFPILEKLFQYILPQNSPLALEMEILILKIFWSFTQFGIPPYLLMGNNNNNFEQWAQMFVQIANQPIPIELEPKDMEERSKMGLWKLKHWVFSIFERYIVRFSAPMKSDNDTIKAFSVLFMERYIIPLLEVCIKFLSGPMGPRTPPTIQTIIINYISNCIYFSKTWIYFKPHMEFMVQSLFFPMLANIRDDVNCYENDPQEYIRLEFNYSQDYISPRSAVLGFISDVIKLRGEEYLDMVMTHCFTALNRYLQAEPQLKNYGEKHAVMLLLGNLNTFLINSPNYKNNLEKIIDSQIIEEFSSPLGFIRARAMLVFGKYYHIKYQNTERYYYAIQYLINSLSDKALPVSVFSAVALQGFIKNKMARSVIEQSVPQLLEAFLRLMNQVDNDDLVGALDLLIIKYGENIKQYLPVVTSSIVQNYNRIIASRGKDLFDEDDSGTLLTVIELIRTIMTILENTKSVQGMYNQLSPILTPLLLNIEPSLIDLFGDYIVIITYLTFYGDISDDLWLVFDKYVDIYFTWGSDYLKELLKPFDNFISRSNDKFFSRGSMEKIWNIYKQALEVDYDCPIGCDIIEVVFVYSRGKIDSLVGPILDVTLKKLASLDHEYNDLKVSLLQVVANAFYYNPVLTLNYLESQGATVQLFKTWFALLNKSFRRRHHIKVTILALSAILYIPFMQWPQALQSQLKTIVAALMELCKKHMKIKEDESNSSGETTSSSGDSDLESSSASDIPDGTDRMPEDQDLVGKESKKKNRKIYADGEDVEADMGDLFSKLEEMYQDDDSTEIEDDYEFNSLIDDVDEIVFFLEAFQSISKRDTAIYQQLLSTFSTEEQNKLQELANEANQRQSNKQNKPV